MDCFMINCEEYLERVLKVKEFSCHGYRSIGESIKSSMFTDGPDINIGFDFVLLFLAILI